MTDWAKIKRDYLRGATIRDLARTYGLNVSTIGRRCSKEGWVEIREQKANTASKVAEEFCKNDAKLLYDTAHNALLRLQGMLDTMDPKSARSVVGAIKDVKDILGIKSEADMREQEARIANLRKMTEDRDTEIVIKIGEDAEEYSK